MQLEIEQKFRIADGVALQAKLAALGVTWGEPLRQVDTYLQHPARDFRQTDEALRLRQVGEQNYLTYKGPKLDSTTKTRRELEFGVESGNAAAQQCIELFTALGFARAGVVNKTRRVAWLSWAEQSIEIAWDEVDHLAPYLELEILAPPAALDTARAALQSLAEQLELTTSERRSYLELLAAHP